MKRGEVWQADLNPVRGSEQAGFRPVVVLSGNLLNQHLPIVIVAPLTSKLKYYKGHPVIKPTPGNGLRRESELMVFHIRSVSKDRLVKKMGMVETGEISLAIRTLNDILKY